MNAVNDSADYLMGFFMMVSSTYYGTNNMKSRKIINEYLNESLKGLDHRITSILRNKTPDLKLIVNAYTVVAKLISNCSQMIYIKVINAVGTVNKTIKMCPIFALMHRTTLLLTTIGENSVENFLKLITHRAN